MIDSETDQNILVKPEHTLFWVEMDYWAIILVIFGIANVLPINIREASLGIAIILMGIVFFGRLGFSLYHKYIKIENVKTSNIQNQSIPNVTSNNKKEDRISRFATKSKNKKTATSSIVNAKNNNNEKGLNESELKKKAYYAEMRKAREAPKKFASSDHSNYFPGSKMPFIPKNAIMNKNTSEEE